MIFSFASKQSCSEGLVKVTRLRPIKPGNIQSCLDTPVPKRLGLVRSELHLQLPEQRCRLGARVIPLTRGPSNLSVLCGGLL